MQMMGLPPRNSHHLRRSLWKQDSPAATAARSWSATATGQGEGEQAGLDDLEGPFGPEPQAAHVTGKEVMSEIHSNYDLNVKEAEHMEWLVSSGVLPLDNLFAMCDHMGCPRRSQMNTPMAEVPDQSCAAAHPSMPQSWASPQQKHEPADPYQSPDQLRVRRPERYNLFTTSPGLDEGARASRGAQPAARPWTPAGATRNLRSQWPSHGGGATHRSTSSLGPTPAGSCWSHARSQCSGG